MSDNVSGAILTITLFIIGGFIAIKYSLKADEKWEKENEQLADDLHWNLHTGNPNGFNPSLKFPIDKNYFFFQSHVGSMTSYYYDGKYKNAEFTLVPYMIAPQGGRTNRNYLTVEIKTAPDKNYDFIIMSKAESTLKLSEKLHEYKNVELEGNEFNKKFLVYTRQEDQAFYDLPPDKMAKLIDIDQMSNINELYIQVNHTAILICGDYAPYVDYADRKNNLTKEQIFSGFMDIAVMINNTLVGSVIS